MARMYMDILEDQTSLRDVRDALQNLPEELDDLYQEAWASIQTQKPGHRRLAQQVVHWLSSAFTQMTIEQLRQALAVRNGDSKLDSESLPEVDALIPVCQGLVKIDRESKVIRLAHYTTQIFFDGIRSASFPDVHQDIATTCLTYLMFDTFEQGPCQFISSRAFDIGGARGEIKSSSILARRIAHNPLMFYAAHHWGDHARGTPEKAIESHILTFLKMPQRLASAIQARYVGSEYQYDGALKATGSLALHVVVCFGLEHILQRLLGTLSKIEINGIDCRGKTALHWAVESRSTNIAQLLLQAGADLDSPIRGEKSLSNRMIMGAGAKISEWKWRVGNELDEETFAKGDLVYIAVESNQDVLLSNYISKCTSGSEVKKRANNVLCKASLLDKPDLIELALGLGADIDTRDHQGKTPLIVAVERLHSDAVQTLTSKGASTNMKYGSGGETYLLQQAIESQGVFDDRLTLVRKFFVTTLEERHFGKRPRQTPANSDVVDKLGDVFRSKPTLPLPQNTAQYRRFLVALHEDRTQGQIIEALLDHEADLSVKTPNGQTLLHLGICSASRLDIILKDSQKNVRKIPDVNAKDAKGRTALHYAAAAGNSAAMQTLLSHGADIKAKDSDSATVLHFAVETYDCISVALQKGATVDATDSSGRSPAHYYAMLADDPDPDNLTPWQKAQLRPSLDKDEREAAGKNSEHFMYLPRNCDNASGLLLDKAYREAKIVGSIAKDMYGKTLYDYTFATKEAQRGFKDTAAWLKQMKERYKLRAKAVEEAVTHTLKESQRKRETWSMDIDEIIGREKRWYIEGDNDVEETLDAREALPKRRMFFDGEKPDELDSRHLFLIPT